MTPEEKVRYLREAAAVERCHTLPHHGSYSLGQHQHGCLMLLLALKPDASRALMVAVSVHDVPERWFGDVPYPAKAAMGFQTKMRLQHAEECVLESLGVRQVLTEEEKIWLEHVDKLELFLWTTDQLAMGNRNVEPMRGAIVDWFQAQTAAGYTPPEVRGFFMNHYSGRTPDNLPEEMKG